MDIFWEIRNSRLGIPDFLLSQILPLDEPERELIFEKLPDITRDFVSTEGLIYLLPQVIQNIVLPTHLQHNYAQLELEQDLSQLSPITESPSQQSQEEEEEFDDIRHVFINERPNASPSLSRDDDFVIDDDTNNSNMDIRANRDDTDDSLRGRVGYDTNNLQHSQQEQVPVVSTIAKTKDDFESFGKNLLFRGKKMGNENKNDYDEEDEEDKKNEENRMSKSINSDGNKRKNKVTTYVLQSNQNNPDQTQVFESTSDSSSSHNNHANQLLKGYDDDDNDNNIHDGDLSDIVRNDRDREQKNSNNNKGLLVLTPRDKTTRSLTNTLQIDNYPHDGLQEEITTDESDQEEQEEKINNDNDNENKLENSSWIRHVGQLFSAKMLGKKRGDLPTKPIVQAVIDTRMKEFALQMISYVWKSPFSKISDSQLIVILITSLCIIGFYLTRNKNMRQRFVRSLKYMSIMALFWIAMFCFIELNIRRKSKLFKKIIDYINKQLFHSEHHKSVQERKKSHSDLNKGSFSVYTEKTSSRRDLLANMAAGGRGGRRRSSGRSKRDLLKKTKSVSLRQIDLPDKKSRFSKTLPYIDLRQRMENKRKKKMNQSIRSQDRVNIMYSSPQSGGAVSVSSGSSLSESPWNTPKQNPILSNRRRTTSSLLIPSNYNHNNKMGRRSTPYT